ncbi:MAG: response regulator transcription factor [Proteobacteria bacterium]|nr:response regulator transcription factor [Pseudomonadota bacterium]
MKVLLIEDHPDIAGNIGDYLIALGHQVDFADNGELGLKLATSYTFDVIVLDINLPKIDGFTLCRRLHDEYPFRTPVLMLTARGSLADKTIGFQVGALDYLVKPFALKELKLRINALVKKQNINRTKVLKIGELALNTGCWEVKRAGKKLCLHKACMQILEILMRSSPHVVLRQDLEYLLWRDTPPPSNPLRSHIHELRKVIDKPFGFAMLRTVKGIGYCLIDKIADEN